MNLKEIKRKAKLAASLLKSYPISAYNGKRESEKFSKLKTYCMFIGYPRSGHSLVGSLIDAHPNAIISHEADILLYTKLGFSRNQMCSLILENSKGRAEVGRANTGYSYVVPNQWQGRFTDLEVMGDKYGDLSTRRIEENPGILDTFQKRMGTQVRFIHVIRNPYDIISTWARHECTTDLEPIIPRYFYLAEANSMIRKKMGEAVLDIRHESLIEDPKKEIRRMCEFLGLEDKNNYIHDCASIIFKSPSKTRENVSWTPQWRRKVKEGIDKFSFLDGYAYDA